MEINEDILIRYINGMLTEEEAAEGLGVELIAWRLLSVTEWKCP